MLVSNKKKINVNIKIPRAKRQLCRLGPFMGAAAVSRVVVVEGGREAVAVVVEMVVVVRKRVVESCLKKYLVI